MRTEKNIFLAFLLNLLFSVLELLGGLFTNSVAIMSDAIHDFGDALSIGISFFLEKKSRKEPDQEYTYGYVRYSILGAFITTIILIIGSVTVIYGAIGRILHPVKIDSNGMIFIAFFGVIINLLAAYFTREGDSLNQKAVNLHMLEDVLGWIVVFLGSILIRFTNVEMIDSIMSIGVALFIFIQAVKNFQSILDLFLEKIPKNISLNELRDHLMTIKGIQDIHHIHVWSIDGVHHYATMHVLARKDGTRIKKEIREELMEFGITHVTIELEEDGNCSDKECKIDHEEHSSLHHH